MILNLFAYCMLAFVNPADPSGMTIYPSGIKNADKKIFGAPESTKLPLLSLGFSIKDKNDKIVPTGFYLASISQDNKYILLFENNYISGVFKISNFKDLEKNVPMNSAVIKIYQPETALITIRQDKKEAYAIVNIAP